MYQNIRGTSASEVAVKFDCSKSVPCQGILLQDINLVHKGKNDDKSAQAEASCKNVKWKNRGRVSPQCGGGWRREMGDPIFANAWLGHCIFKIIYTFLRQNGLVVRCIQIRYNYFFSSFGDKHVR